MKNISWITGMNFLLLVLVIVTNSTTTSGMALYVSLSMLVLFNLALGTIYIFKGQKEKLKSLVLSALVVTAIGISSCVTIKPRKKKPPKQKPPVEQPQPPRV